MNKTIEMVRTKDGIQVVVTESEHGVHSSVFPTEEEAIEFITKVGVIRG